MVGLENSHENVDPTQVQILDVWKGDFAKFVVFFEDFKHLANQHPPLLDELAVCEFFPLRVRPKMLTWSRPSNELSKMAAENRAWRSDVFASSQAVMEEMLAM